MNLRPAVFAFLSIGFTLTGCKDKPAPQGATVAPDVAPPTPSASAVVAPAPSASATEPTPTSPRAQGPRFIVHRRSPKTSTFEWLGTGIVICEDVFCMADAQVITEKGLTDTYNPHDAIIAKNPKAFQGSPNTGIRYRGEYPNVCASDIYWNDRTDSLGMTFKRSGKTWVHRGDCPNSPDYYGDEPPLPRPPRDLDDALLHAPIADAAKTIIRGAGSPPMLVAEETLYIWDGKAWAKHEAPWKKSSQELNRNKFPLSQRPVRLTSGATLVPFGGYLIDTKGEISALNLTQDDKPISPHAEVMGALWTNKFPWLIAFEDKDVYLATPDTSEKVAFVRAILPERAPATKTATPPVATASPSASASAAPSAAATPEPSPSASAAASAAAPPTTNAPSLGLTEPKPFTSACTTPFVLLASPPKPGQAYATTREGLRGHGEFQDLVTFVEFVVEGKTYFGVQTRTEADANQFMAVVEKSVKGMKPALRCLDVLSQVPNRYAPPEGIRIVGINLTTGELVPFD